MCIIVYKPKKHKVNKQNMLNCHLTNNNGMGLMYADNGQLYIHKELSDFSAFWNEIERHQDKRLIIHFRMATHGTIDLENCHPFLINENLAFCHNGIFTGYGSHKEGVSDTRDFNEKVLKQLPADFLNNPGICQLLSEAIGSDKLAFMDANNKIFLVNSSLGVWEDNIWYSNQTYKHIPYRLYSMIGRGYGWNGWHNRSAWEDYEKQWNKDTGKRITAKSLGQATPPISEALPYTDLNDIENWPEEPEEPEDISDIWDCCDLCDTIDYLFPYEHTEYFLCSRCLEDVMS